MRLTAGCTLSFTAIAPAALTLMLRPRSSQRQWVIREAYQLDPLVPISEYIDSYGNLCQRLAVAAGPLTVQTQVQVETQETIAIAPGAPFVPVAELPDAVLQFLLPSRYCPCDRLGDLAQTIVAQCAPGYDQVAAIQRWIQNHIEYCYGTSDASTSAWETIQRRRGVCRDFAHLGIALCRSLNIPARMAMGYLHQLQPMDLHAWFEAFVGGRWYLFDATQKTPRGQRITIAYGRDAADVALATQFGPLELTEMRVWVEAVDQAEE